jgi:SAM-dependent methyltransferase
MGIRLSAFGCIGENIRNELIPVRPVAPVIYRGYGVRCKASDLDLNRRDLNLKIQASHMDLNSLRRKRLAPPKPISYEPSPLVRDCVSYLEYRTSGCLAADIGCGYGRNAMYLSSKGISTLAIDIDEAALSYLARILNLRNESSACVHPLRADLSLDIPLKPNSLDIVLSIHLPPILAMSSLFKYVKPDGLLVFETFGNRGGNWIDLPKRGEIKEQLLCDFRIRRYEERIAGPAQAGVCCVKAIASKL